jgi:hypothetical protein
MIHRFKETKDCKQEVIEEKQQNNNVFHLGRIIESGKRQSGIVHFGIIHIIYTLRNPTLSQSQSM